MNKFVQFSAEKAVSSFPSLWCFAYMKSLLMGPRIIRQRRQSVPQRRQYFKRGMTDKALTEYQDTPSTGDQCPKYLHVNNYDLTLGQSCLHNASEMFGKKINK